MLDDGSLKVDNIITIVESRVRLTWYQSYARTPKEKEPSLLEGSKK